jgi:predicted outer membrane lipoprotein
MRRFRWVLGVLVLGLAGALGVIASVLLAPGASALEWRGGTT